MSADELTLQQRYMLAAISNPALCDGTTATVGDLERWFGPSCRDITRAQVAAMQAQEVADAAIASRLRSPHPRRMP